MELPGGGLETAYWGAGLLLQPSSVLPLNQATEGTLTLGGGRDSLQRNVYALVVHERSEPCQALKLVLRRLHVDTFSVGSCAEAAHLLEQTQPHLIFTDTKLPDGTWIDVVTLAEEAAVPICAILVGSSKDPELFQSALSYGAFDYVSPPFDTESISQLLAQAMALVRTRRERDSRAAVA